MRSRHVRDLRTAQGHVAVVAYEDAELAGISCATTGLDVSKRVGGQPPYRVRLVSLGGRAVRCGSGLEFRAQARLEDPVEELDTLMCPEDPNRTRPPTIPA